MADSLPEQLAQGVALLRREAFEEAADALEPVYAAPELAAAEELADIRARVCSLYAQALLGAGRPTEADEPCRQAIRLLRRLRDKPGLDAVRDLQNQIVARLVQAEEHARRLEEAATVAATPLASLLADAHGPLDRAEVLVKKAHAHLDTGDPVTAADLARAAVGRADDATHDGLEGATPWRVHARLALARALPEEAAVHLVAAYRCAERAGEFNLVSTVARAAELARVQLPLEHGPHLGRPSE